MPDSAFQQSEQLGLCGSSCHLSQEKLRLILRTPVQALSEADPRFLIQGGTTEAQPDSVPVVPQL